VVFSNDFQLVLVRESKLIKVSEVALFCELVEFVFVGNPEGHGVDARGANKKLINRILGGAVDLTTHTDIIIRLAIAAARSKLALVLARFMALHDQLYLDFAMVTPGAKTAPNAICAQDFSTVRTKGRTFV